MITKLPAREEFLLIIVLTLVFGSLALAVLDPSYRQSFADIAKIGISGFIGLMVPTRQQDRDLP